MTEYLVFFILIITMALFIWGRWRYDVVALLALMATVMTGAIPFAHTFSGFSNPAVITVATVMIITEAISGSGIVDFAVRSLAPVTTHTLVYIAVLTIIAGFLSAFMNNVGALALIMPVAMQTAIKTDRSPSLILMPIAFGSILGGMTTLIGTPPNILIANYRTEAIGKPFGMFAFTPVGIVLASVGIIFIVLVGWRLIPKARLKSKAVEDVFKIKDYVTEVLIPEDSPLVGQTIADLENLTTEGMLILGLIRENRKRLNVANTVVLKTDDVVIVEAPSSGLEELVSAGKLRLVASKDTSSDILRSKEVGVLEVVIVPGSKLEGRTPMRLRLRSRYGINLLAIAREGKPFKQRLKNVKLFAGDVLLLQGPAKTLSETAIEIGFLPLAERGVRLGTKQGAILPVSIFAVALVLTAVKLLPVQIAFSGAVLAMILTNVIPIRKVYESIDWGIVVLLGAMIPVGNALQTTGGTQLIADVIVQHAGQFHPVIILGLIMVITMALSDVMNNAATAVVMAPISITIAKTLGFSVDPFLMTVAVGASCAFLTPIGHQNNTLVMGPGGYHFGDYWRMGLPLEIIILIISLPLIIWVWPLH